MRRLYAHIQQNKKDTLNEQINHAINPWLAPNWVLFSHFQSTTADPLSVVYTRHPDHRESFIFGVFSLAYHLHHLHTSSTTSTGMSKVIGSLINEYRLIKLIGTGAYGLVYLAENTRTGGEVAIKCVAKKIDKSVKKQSDALVKSLYEYLQSENFAAQSLRLLSLKRLEQADSIPCPFVKEVSLQLQVHHHPNVVSIRQILDSPVAIFIIMDYFAESDLFVNIVDRQVYIHSPQLIKDVFVQLLDVISYCHSKGIYHCDIKPENILVANQGSRLMIADFGLAVKSRYIQAKTCIGSSYYMPPERLVAVNHNFTKMEYPAEKGDLWSLAVILINLCCTRNPWLKACDQDATYDAFKKDPKVLLDLLNINQELYEILRDCFREDPEDRISLFELRDRVIRCQGFTKSGPLSHCAEFDMLQDGMECAVPDDASYESEGSLELPQSHLVQYAEYLKERGKGYSVSNYSILANKSFNMNTL